MADQKKNDFVVSDRRKFTIEGDLRPETKADEEPSGAPLPQQPADRGSQASAQETSGAAQQPPEAGAAATEDQPPAPSAAEQSEQAAAYKSQTADIDARIQKELDQRNPGRKASDFEMTFDKFVASLYMTALMQLGLVHEQGMQARPDIMAARQTIDTISILADKTKGNLTAAEETLMQNVLYELRMAYIEVTNALTRAPQAPVDPNAGLK
ncbi:MAG TPA: DUF1844 domain-containing protein [Terriglobales bacterium]|nr:DUF1844 domain-containing protein [Terriglobales bacterium]